jgi:plasmid stabilization system protein ParE
LVLIVRIKPRAEREIKVAAAWWSVNRPAAPGAIRIDLQAALEAVASLPDVGRKVENARDPETRRLFLSRIKYHVYYRPRGKYLEVLAFWHASRGEGPSV